jgi:glutamate dehydrogenase/leucine dehydrogenase
VLVLTSGSNELNQTNCRKMTAGIVIEADYNAIEGTVREALAARSTSVLPWFLATCGTPLACYWEAYQHQILARPEELLTRCYGIVRQEVEGVLKHSFEKGCSVDRAAYRLAVEAAANCVRACGLQH